MTGEIDARHRAAGRGTRTVAPFAGALVARAATSSAVAARPRGYRRHDGAVRGPTEEAT